MKKTIWNSLAAVVLVFAMAACSMPSGLNETNEQNQDSFQGSMVARSLNAGTDYSLNLPPAQVNPAGLPSDQTPMFVSIGFDDNGYSGLPGSGGVGAMKWALDYFRNKSNPGVTGTGVFDGTPARVTFFNTTVYAGSWMSEDPALVREAWRIAYEDGHEIGNHSVNHPNDTGRNFGLDRWLTEMTGCHDLLTKPVSEGGLGLRDDEIIGWRTPHLAYTDALFGAIKRMGYEYDCSINEGFEYDQDGTNYFWPYTLDNGSPGNKITADWGTDPLIGSHPGLFEMPVYALIVPPDNKCAEYGIPAGLRAKMKTRQSWFDEEGGKITGFDYNLWFLFGMSKSEFLATLKYSFDLRHNGNKAPFMLGAHTDYYSSKYNNPAGSNSTYLDRQEAITEFMDYAMSKQDVRVVPFKNILGWIKDSVTGPVEKVKVSALSGPNGTLNPEGIFEVNKGSSVEIAILPDSNFEVDEVTIDGVPVQVIENRIVLPNLQNDVAVYVTFKEFIPLFFTIDARSGDNGTLQPEGLVKVKQGDSITFTAIPDQGYEIDSAVLNGAAVQFVNNQFTIPNVQSDGELVVTFIQSHGPDGLRAVYEITQDWGTGFGGKVTVTNHTNKAVNGWRVLFTYAGDVRITGLWNAVYVQDGKNVTVENPSWNGTIPAGGSVSFGFNGTYTQANEIPVKIIAAEK